MKRIIVALAALIVSVAAILMATVQADENETSTRPLIETPTAINETSTPPVDRDGPAPDRHREQARLIGGPRLRSRVRRAAALSHTAALSHAARRHCHPVARGPARSHRRDALHASPRVLTAGQSFTLRATVRNKGDAESDSTTLRYYLSNDSTISSDDTEVGTDDIARIPAAVGAILRFNNEFIQLDAPSTPGVHRYGACVDAVVNESDTTNNCSSSVTIRVRATPTPVPTP